MYVTHRSRGRHTRQALRRRLGGERGFTLIELLVAMGAATIVSAATFAILVISLHLGSNYDDRVDANQQGRLAMQKLVLELNSSCVAATTPPILSGSDSTHLNFYSSETDAPTILPTRINVTYTAPSGNTPGTLVQQTYANTGSAGSWSFTGTPSSFTLLADAAQATISSTTQPVFTYYGYNSDGTVKSTAFTTPLSSTDASNTAIVLVQFKALPSDNWAATNRGADFSDEVALRLSPASADASNSPCT
jgi:prepilin-type N-terminal cleavage/methylation domain-containing protein